MRMYRLLIAGLLPLAVNLPNQIDEECAIRAEPLGSDRRYNRYWLFTTGEAGDAGSALLWVETAPEGSWRLLTTPQQLDELTSSLEPQGVREGQLAQALARCADRIKHSMPGGRAVSTLTRECLGCTRCHIAVWDSGE